MKETKLRAWDVENKVMLSPEELWIKHIYWIPDGRGFVETVNTGEIFSPDLTNEWMNHFIPLEYTGLKDKNGKEIYEGDIVSRYGEGQHEVYWHENTACWRTTGHTGMNRGGAAMSLEVIGNIYSDPELVKGVI